MDLQSKLRKHNFLADDEVQALVDGIPVLKNMFKDRQEHIYSENDNTQGILYLSRINGNEHRTTKKEDEDSDSETDFMFGDEKRIETKSLLSDEQKDLNRGKKRRFAYSLSTLALQPDKRAVIIKHGAMESLLELSSINDIPIRRSCASAFSSLSSEAKLRPVMIDSGAFSGIIALANTPSKSVKADCSRALCNLCCVVGCEFRAVKEGCPFALVQIVAHCPENTLICLKTLLNLSCVHDKYPRLEEVIDAVLQLNSATLSSEETVVILSALCNLSALKNNQIRLVECGCVRVVEGFAKVGHTALIRSITGEIIRNLTTCSRSRGKLIDQNIVTTLITMSKDESESVRISCVHAFYNLSRDFACREKIVHSNAVAVIIRMSMEKMNNVDMGRTAAKTLRILCTDRYIASKLVGDGIVRALMSLIKTDDVNIRQFCAESICCLFENEAVVSRLIEQGAVNVLVSLSLNDDVDVLTGEWCAFAFFHLASNSFCNRTMLANGILPCLIKLASAPSAQTKRFCAAAIWSITIKKIVDASPAIPVLVYMLRDETSQEIKVDCASALYNLADDDANCELMLSAGALLPVVRLTQSDYLQTKIKCAAILSRLSQHEKYYAQFGTEDVLKVLLELSRLDHAVTQRRVVIALTNLSQIVEIRRMLLDLNATLDMVSLASKPDEHVRRGCAAIMCNLSYEEGSEKRMIKSGAVSTLLITALVTSDQLETKIICAKALVNLMSETTEYAQMIKDGVIWGMGNLSLIDNQDILDMCAKALCNLSFGYAKEMLTSSSTVSSIMKLINQKTNIDIQRDSARLLTNILMKTTDEDEDFRRNAVRNMLTMVKCKDKMVSEMCIYCLCMASQSASCRETIVSSGMLSMLDVSTIFNEPSVCFAYLTMFGNIANNPVMRSQILDENSIDRFMHICRSQNANLDLAVIKALYCVSCDRENIIKLVNQNALSIIRVVLQNSRDMTNDLVHHVLAFCFNLTTEKVSQRTLVSQRIVEMLMMLWPVGKVNQTTCLLLMKSICHLACGSVNTSQMVSDGCGEILCFNPANYNLPYEFEDNLFEMISASFRNLCCIISNQEALVKCGSIKSIVDMSSPKDQKRLEDLKFQVTRKNCASALRSLTYNISIRQQLVDSGAIRVILYDLNKNFEFDSLAIKQELMCELEAESWCNGSRGTLKESRAPSIKMYEVYTNLLGGTPNVKLNVEAVTVEQTKYVVKVVLDEPPIESEGAMQSIGQALQDLTSFATEDNLNPMTCVYPKQESEISKTAKRTTVPRITSKNSMRSMGDAENGNDSSDDDVKDKKEMLLMPAIREEDASVSSSKLTSLFSESANSHDMKGKLSSVSGSDIIVFPSKPLDDINSRNGVSAYNIKDDVETLSLGDSSGMTDASSTTTSSISHLPSLIKKLNKHGIDTNENDVESTFKSVTSLKSSQKRNAKREFKGLVALINHGAKSKKKESELDNVITRWNQMSKY